MKCPKCKTVDLKVCRTERYDASVTRIRYCPCCLRRFKTDEEGFEPYPPKGLNYKEREKWFLNNSENIN